MDRDQLLTIGGPNRICMNCDTTLEQIGRHPSVLKNEQGRLERLDYCPQCWDHIKAEVFDSYWLAHRRSRSRPLPKLSRRERATALSALFESLRERCQTEDVEPHLFLISHLLMKWGALKWHASQTDLHGREIVTFEEKCTGDRFEIASVDIDEHRLASIKREIEAFLRQYAPDNEIPL